MIVCLQGCNPLNLDLELIFRSYYFGKTFKYQYTANN